MAGCCKICLSLAPRKLEAPGWPSVPGQLSKLFCNGDILNRVSPSREVTWLAPPWSEDVRQGGFLSILNWPKYYALQSKIFGHERDFFSQIVFSQKVMTYTEVHENQSLTLVRGRIAHQRQEGWHDEIPAARVVFLGNSFWSPHFFFLPQLLNLSFPLLVSKKFNFLFWMSILVELHFFWLVNTSPPQDYFNPIIFPRSWESSRNWVLQQLHSHCTKIICMQCLFFA